MEARYLVYLRGLKGPEPQLWYGDQTKGTGQFQHKPVGAEDGDLLYFRRLEGVDTQDGVSLQALVAKYPYEKDYTFL